MAYKYTHKIDALTAILRKLNNGERVTVGILSEELNVGERSIYRYMESLQAAGYPIYFDREKLSYRFADTFALERSPTTTELTQVLDLDKQVVNLATVAIAAYRSHGECVLCNEAMRCLLGVAEGSVYGQNFRQLPAWRESGLLAMAETALESGAEQSGDFRMVAATGREVWFHCTMTQIMRGGESYLVMMAQDLAPRMQKELQVAKFFAAINQHPHLIMITDTDGAIRYISGNVESLTGYTMDEVIGRNPRMFKSCRTSPEVHAALWSAISNGREWSGELCNQRKDGTEYWEHLRISPIFDEDAVITHYVAIKEDITRQKSLDEELYQYAVLDHLTGVYNSRMLHSLGGREVSMARRYLRPVTLLILDIDRLGAINHLHGHPVGDGVLRQVAAVCRSQMRATDILARLEGDTFAFLLPETDQKGAYRVAERIRRQVAELTFTGAGGGTFSCTVSIAGAFLSQDQGDIEQMIRAGSALLRRHQPVMTNRVVGFAEPES